jgi:hypothetical protein
MDDNVASISPYNLNGQWISSNGNSGVFLFVGKGPRASVEEDFEPEY